MSDTTKIILMVCFAVIVFISVPIATIWSLNVLFPILAIPYTLQTWLAAFVLFAGVSGIKLSNKK